MTYDPAEFIRHAMRCGVIPQFAGMDKVTFTINANSAFHAVIEAARDTGVLPPSLTMNKRREITKLCNGFDDLPEVIKWLAVCYVSQRVKKMVGREPTINAKVNFEAATAEYDAVGGMRGLLLGLYSRLGQDMLTTSCMDALAMTEKALQVIPKLTEDCAKVLFKDTEDRRRRSQMGMIAWENEETLLRRLLGLIEAEVRDK